MGEGGCGSRMGKVFAKSGRFRAKVGGASDGRWRGVMGGHSGVDGILGAERSKRGRVLLRGKLA